MAKIYCFRHPEYDGKDSPVLSCKTCCGIFVATLKSERDAASHVSENKKPDSIEQWFEEKKRKIPEPKAAKSGFRPELI